ncbi:MAG: hypothetical protein JSW70_07690 [Syntrophobacterales bacterium]|nr:MAG: hypothetical protein JSW70_07690 [Syntrophobacterales bacterium]
MRLMKRLISVWVGMILLISISVTPLSAEEPTEPSPDEIAVDLLLIRPVAFSSIILGSGIFVVSLPFTIPTGNLNLAGRKLVVVPFKYTFSRPLGQLDGDF